jgi:ankyrin repeat protein
MDKKNEDIKKFELKSMVKVFLEEDFQKLLDFINDFGINSVEKKDGRNIFIYCIINNKTEWAIKLLEEYKDLNINAQGKDGFSALHFSVQEKNTNVLEKLLKNKNIIVDITENNGNTPLWKAMFGGKGDENIILKLLEAGADINKANNYGIKPSKYFKETMEKVNKYIIENKIKIIN